ncbi:DUF86 domain-containing protein [Sphingomonas sp. RP10(2022)]|uniref:DUF86 domain-containing protein n=1 Tax=Sphingomonas liriopis TaxID=2949094 RepID=A0A9X2HW85_9SPHN|nr:HepT-like ribonuclease domain-containing protein [Sphingomonas liriopis]MCP3734674.1 DUF86 domain-containing protein [Sphingomonas liriopis]
MSSDRIRSRLEHVVEYADHIAEYLTGYDVDRFLGDRKTVDAVERCLERIAEAIVQIGAEEMVTMRIPVPWNEVRGLGNRLRHEYRRIDKRLIFDTARNDIPPLRDAALRALGE